MQNRSEAAQAEWQARVDDLEARAALNAERERAAGGPPQYVTVDIDPDERPGDSSHGERIDERTGLVEAPYYAPTRPCGGEPDNRGRHAEECACGGVGTLLVRQTSVYAPTPVDDSLRALEAAIGIGREEHEREYRPDPHMGDPTVELMKRQVQNRKSSGSGRGRKKAIDPKRIAAHPPHPSITAGRIEVDTSELKARRGRPTTFAEPRPEMLRPTIAPATAEALKKKSPKPVSVSASRAVAAILRNPQYEAVLAEFRGRQMAREAADPAAS